MERPLHPMEWPKPDSPQLLPHHRDRCLKEGVGGSVQRSLHRGTMEPQRMDHAHQLPRAPSSLSGSAVFCQECDNPPQDGQHVSTDIHQQTWGNDLPTAEQPSQRDVAVVYGMCHGRIHSLLGRAQSICQPTMEPDRQSPSTDPPTTGGVNTSGTCVEGTGLVPSDTGNASGLSTPDPPEEGPNHSHTPRQLSRSDPPASHVASLRQRYKDCQILEEATKLLLASWRQKSSRTYDSLFGKWASWCSEQDCDPISCPIGEVINFLGHLFEQGYQYCSINSYRSAISSVHEKIDGYEIGQHPLVARTLKGIFHERPPQPRYSETWDVTRVTSYIESLGDNDNLSLADLTHNTVMLLALTRPSRSADMSHLDLTFRRYLPEGVAFQPTKLAKQARQSKPKAEFFFPAFAPNHILCPVTVLRA